MPAIRSVACIMAAAGEVELRQRGRVLSPYGELRGAIRISTVPASREGPASESER